MIDRSTLVPIRAPFDSHRRHLGALYFLKVYRAEYEEGSSNFRVEPNAAHS